MQRFAGNPGIIQGRRSQSHRLLNSSKYGNPAIVSKNCQIKQNNYQFGIFTENWRLEYPRCKLCAPLRKFNSQQG
jgi:hypothetical protein